MRIRRSVGKGGSGLRAAGRPACGGRVGSGGRREGRRGSGGKGGKGRERGARDSLSVAQGHEVKGTWFHEGCDAMALTPCKPQSGNRLAISAKEERRFRLRLQVLVAEAACGWSQAGGCSPQGKWN